MRGQDDTPVCSDGKCAERSVLTGQEQLDARHGKLRGRIGGLCVRFVQQRPKRLRTDRIRGKRHGLLSGPVISLDQLDRRPVLRPAYLPQLPRSCAAHQKHQPYGQETDCKYDSFCFHPFLPLSACMASMLHVVHLCLIRVYCTYSFLSIYSVSPAIRQRTRAFPKQLSPISTAIPGLFSFGKRLFA